MPTEMAEQTSHLTNIETLTGGVRYRWGMVCGGAALLALGRFLELSEIAPWPLVCLVVAGGIANLALVSILRLDWPRPWLTYVYCLIDVSLVGLAVVYLGPGTTIAVFLLVVLPCASRPSRVLSLFALFAASVAYLIAAAVHGLLSSGTDGGAFSMPPGVFIDLGLFLAVAATLMAAHGDLFRRIAGVHSVIRNAIEGSFERQTPSSRNDQFGRFEQSTHSMLEQVASTVQVVQLESEVIADLARSIAQSASVAGESSRQVALMASDMVPELENLRLAAETGQTEGTDAAQTARTLQARAEDETGDAHAFEETVQRGRDRIARTGESVSAIGADISRATNTVNELGGLSRQIGSSALSIAKVARHTHVLALNAAIEAARAEEHGKEFAVVADQVRTLAGEAGRSARDVGDLISEVQAGIMAAASALLAGEKKVNDIGVIVGETRSTLNELRSGASHAADLASTTADVSRNQSARAGSLASMMSQFAANSARWSIGVNETAEMMAAQITALDDLDQANRQLVELADRLRENVTWSSLHRTEPAVPTDRMM